MAVRDLLLTQNQNVCAEEFDRHSTRNKNENQ